MVDNPKLFPIINNININKLVNTLHILATATAVALAHSLTTASALKWGNTNTIPTIPADTIMHPNMTMLRCRLNLVSPRCTHTQLPTPPSSTALSNEYAKALKGHITDITN